MRTLSFDDLLFSVRLVNEYIVSPLLNVSDLFTLAELICYLPFCIFTTVKEVWYG